MRTGSRARAPKGGGPARRVRPSRVSVTGVYPSRFGAIAYESALERDFIELMDFDLDVVDLRPQPLSITYETQGQPHHYYPDFLVHRERLNPKLIEVKYQADLQQLADELRPKFAAARHLAKENGWTFDIVTEKEIRTQLLRNAHFLLPFRNREPDPSDVAEVLGLLSRTLDASLQQVLGQLRRDAWNQAALVPTIWHLVASGSLLVDLTQPLTRQTRFTVAPRRNLARSALVHHPQGL